VKVSKFLSGGNLSQYVIPTLQKLFKDEALDVRSELISTLGMYPNVIGKENVKKYLIPLINGTVNEKNWRTRLAIVEYIPRLCKDLGYDIYREDISGIISKFLFDHIFAIRDQCVENFKQITEFFGYEKIKDNLMTSLSDLSRNGNYLFRITAIQSLQKLKDLLDKKTLSTLFEEFAEKMLDDKVPNVRFNLLRIFKAIKDKLPPATISKYNKLFEKLVRDSDSDVSFFADQALKN
jgi:serine/threonine-protein phosphatase 2A regulatory subunit A